MDGITDTHAHLTDDRLFDDVEKHIAHAKELGTKHIVNINTDQTTLKRGLKLAKSHSCIHNTGATTPHDVQTLGESDFPVFQAAAEEGKLVAIGETGLDYFYEHAPRDLQQHFLRKYFHLAKRLSLPVVIHCRDAFADLFAIAKEEYVDEKGQVLPAVLHCFTGTMEEAEEAIKLGWYVSFSGIVTFNKSEALREVAKHLPLENIFVETDAPYLSPVPVRGKLNVPGHVRYTAECIAKLHQISLEELAQITTKNAEHFFSLDE